MINRREMLRGSLAALAAAHVSPMFAQAEKKTFTPWTPGTFDIHHISTARGNSALLVFPDGTTMMIDAGALYANTPYLEAPRPSAERRPGEWLGRYAQRHLRAAGLPNRIDSFLLTHHHDDHMGAVPPGQAKTAGGYVLTGVSDVDAIVPIQRFVDRDPAFAYPSVEVEGYARGPQENYQAFLGAKTKAGVPVEALRVGVADQFRMLHDAAKYPTFEVRNLAANGEVWTGKGSTTSKHFPQLSTLQKSEYPSENCCSCAVRVRYGKFAYYSGGDLPNGIDSGQPAWADIETPVAEACGPVSVAVVNHHGYYDADGPAFARALRPRVFVIEAWDSAHPTVNTMQTMLSQKLYPGPRDVFATFLNEHNRLANKGTDKMRAHDGHVVVRVDPGGATYNVHVLSNRDESDTVQASFGPYTA